MAETINTNFSNFNAPIIQRKNAKFTLRKFTIYELIDENKYLIIGSNRLETIFRILTIDVFPPSNSNNVNCNIKEENIIYTRDEILNVISTLKVKKLLTSIGFFGVTKFTKFYYLVCITSVKKVAVLGGHYMNHIESVEYISLSFDKNKSSNNDLTDGDDRSNFSNDQNSIPGSADFENENSSSRRHKKNKITEEEKENEKRNLKIESKIMDTLFDNLKITKNFYFSYTYDLTNSLQTNLLREKLKMVERTDINVPYNQMKPYQSNVNYNDLFIWNHHLLQPILVQLETTFDWFQPIIHGFINQIDIPILPNNTSNKISICIIARRSRKFAGLRFLKRGVNNEGYVANEVESEQIVSNSLTTSFHDNGDGENIKFYGNDKYTSFLQHRGSVPLNWSQDLNLGIKIEENDQLSSDKQQHNYHPSSQNNNNGNNYKELDKDNKLRIKTKPPINMYLMDPYYRNAGKHFNDMFARYGGNKILVLDLLKQNTSKKKNKKKKNFSKNEEFESDDDDDDILKGRESVLGKEYRDCIAYLNQFLPEESKIQYVGFDMSRVSKQFNNIGENKVIEFLEAYASKVIQKIGVFQNNLHFKDMKLQSGIVRVSCQDCLDRTNASQFIIGKKALAEQLRLLKILPEKYINEDNDAFLEYDSLISNLYTNLYQSHGNTIALQYGSSHLVNTIATYRKDLKLKNGWRRESSNNLRDLMESFKRYYNNSFYDAGRQEAINIFLGIWQYKPNEPLIWDLKTDYYLHNNFKVTECDIFNSKNKKKSYRVWYTPEFLTPLKDLLQREIVDLGNDITIEKYQKKLKDFPKFIDSYWSIHYDLGQYTDLSTGMEFNLFLDNCTEVDEESEDKKDIGTINKNHGNQGLFGGDKKIGRGYHSKTKKIIKKQENDDIVDIMKKYDDMYGYKSEYLIRLDELKKMNIIDDITDDCKTKDSEIEKFYKNYELQAENIECLDENVYTQPIIVKVNESLY
ncbi:hypothetical protein HANVADRAFT_51373 [Hanseniaspora valbyensis NRRL Y-1626]|uniref:SAC domain-containing protein n=1 Tax=Hanseniaspora valbyensis NRRL Y-1626 TaxID=766949 RepID=A0A1B7TIJ2_9ASCO|nr:hypothetical protein HANVADRAFT_51373 [Hanseniaspora valbyensis NRRL Y-1626]